MDRLLSDSGDGFDSTYAIAYLLGQKTLAVEGVDDALPRGHALHHGRRSGVPHAIREDYEKRMKRPYQLPFPTAMRKGRRTHPCFSFPEITTGMTGWSCFSPCFAVAGKTRLEAGAPVHSSIAATSPWLCPTTGGYGGSNHSSART